MRCLILNWLVLLSCTNLVFQVRAQDAPFRDENTGLVFDDVDGFRRSEIHRYESDALGFSLDYQSQLGIRVTVYVYDLDVQGIPDGAFSEIIRAQVKQSRGDVFRAKEKGHYQDVKELWNGAVVLGDSADSPIFRRITFALRRQDIDYRSELFVTGFKKNFVKLRVTFPADKEPQCQQELKKVTDQIGKAIMAARDKK